jgi:hypothetical protein
MSKDRTCSRGASCNYTHPTLPVSAAHKALIKALFATRPTLTPDSDFDF